MIELKVTSEKLIELHKKGYSSDIVHLLEYVENGEDLDEISKDSPKLGNIIQSLYRKGLISDNHNLTKEGKELISFLSIKENKKIVKKKPSEEPFQSWWAAFPSSDTFDYKGRHFPGTRSLKAKKDDCKLKLNKILNEGQYTIEELIKAIELEVHQKKENSIKTGQNKLSYFQNSHTYLLQYTYESYVELIRKEQKAEKTPENYDGVNI